MGLTQSVGFVTFSIMPSFSILRNSFLSLSSNDKVILRVAAMTGVTPSLEQFYVYQVNDRLL